MRTVAFCCSTTGETVYLDVEDEDAAMLDDLSSAEAQRLRREKRRIAAGRKEQTTYRPAFAPFGEPAIPLRVVE